MKALVVDDSRAMRSILGRSLENLGFEVCQAEHGRDALALLQRQPIPDLALVDWHMPEMDGLELVKTVRANTAFDTMRIIVVTVESEMERVEEALSAGTDEYLMKPFDHEALVAKLGLLGL